jgi:hypothetical protein
MHIPAAAQFREPEPSASSSSFRWSLQCPDQPTRPGRYPLSGYTDSNRQICLSPAHEPKNEREDEPGPKHESVHLPILSGDAPLCDTCSDSVLLLTLHELSQVVVVPSSLANGSGRTSTHIQRARSERFQRNVPELRRARSSVERTGGERFQQFLLIGDAPLYATLAAIRFCCSRS